jgi:hypothetical protein
MALAVCLVAGFLTAFQASDAGQKWMLLEVCIGAMLSKKSKMPPRF